MEVMGRLLLKPALPCKVALLVLWDVAGRSLGGMVGWLRGMCGWLVMTLWCCGLGLCLGVRCLLGCGDSGEEGGDGVCSASWEVEDDVSE